ncbi:hypothetical protein KKH05_01495 [Patescibacteria group bacterium]|nr:hypothetical protein [Patescibacteria group bacterium]
MLGSAITALLFVGFMIAGVYVTNVRDIDAPERQNPSINEGFFADLNSLAGSNESVEGDSDSSKAVPESFLDRLRKKQGEEQAVKPSSVFKGSPAPAQPSTLFPKAQVNTQTQTNTQAGVEGTQDQVDTNAGSTSLTTPDACNNLPGVQATIPVGKISNGIGGCISPAPEDVYEVPSWWDDFLSEDDDLDFLGDDDDI